MWILLISPYESSTNQWEAIVFATEAEAIQVAKQRDLTKEHYIAPVSSVVELFQQMWADEDEKNGE